MKLLIIPFIHYTRLFMPRVIVKFLEKVAERERSSFKYWFISGVMSFSFVILYYGLFKS